MDNNKSNRAIFKKNVHVYSHLDADGLCSAVILAKTLQNENIGYQISILDQLDSDSIIKIKEEAMKGNKFIIFSDFGSGQIKQIEENFQNEDYLILDHHRPLDIENLEDYSPKINHINPYFYGINGSEEICGAGMCYYFAKAINSENIKLSYLAIIGAIGDMQNKGPKGTFIGANEEIVKDAVDAGTLRMESNIAVSRTLPIVQALAYTLQVVLPGISGDDMAAQNFLENRDIRTSTELNEPRRLIDLADREKRVLNNGIIQYAIVDNGMNASIVKKLITTFYILLEINVNGHFLDAKEMAQILNSCGRTGVPSLGIALLLGDKKAFKQINIVLNDYKKEINKGLKYAAKNIKDMGAIRVINGRDIVDKRKIGTIISRLVHQKEFKDKPLIGYAEAENEFYKISARTSMKLVERGLDLGEIINIIVKKLNITDPGGGHPPAAGAKVPKSLITQFLNTFNKKVKEILK